MIPSTRTRQLVPVGGRPSRMARPVSTVDAAPSEGTLGAVTDSNLPRPGASGLGWVRETHPIPVAGRMIDAGKRSNPRIPTVAGAIRNEKGAAPAAIPDAHPLAEPTGATTAEALVRFKEDINDRHKRLFHRLPDVGGLAPWQGVRFKFSKERTGGVPSLPAPILAGTNPPDPRTVPSQGTTYRGLRAAVSAARRGLKPVVRLSPGLGGLDAAQSVRQVPDTPSGAREIIRDIRAKRLHGALIGQRTAPESVVNTLAATRAQTMVPPAPPMQTSTEYLGETLAAPNLSKAKPVPTEPVALVANTASEGDEPSPNPNFALIAVAIVAALVLLK